MQFARALSTYLLRKRLKLTCCTVTMAWLLTRACCPKALPWTSRCLCRLVSTRSWSQGPLTAYMPEAVSFPGAQDHQSLYKTSVEQGDAFWGALARSRLTWITPFHSVQDCDLHQGRAAWFLGGQLNVAGEGAVSPMGCLTDGLRVNWEGRVLPTLSGR